jgi:glycerol-3-phosphate cytidylyltransferase
MIIYTQGSFDILHSGHINLLRKCRLLAGNGRVIVALLTDKAYTAYRHHSPSQSFEDRKSVLKSVSFVDEVIPCDNVDTKKQIEEIKPDFCVLGTDWVTKDIYRQWAVTPEFIDPIILYVPYTTHISSTMIKEKIRHE